MAWYKCSGGGEGIPLITKSGSIVTYEDSVGGVPVNDLVAQIVATQSGTGDPSPSNVRPISGYTGVNVTRAGKNLAVLAESSKNDSQYCTYAFTNNGIDITAMNKYARTSFVFPVKSGQTYTISFYGYGTANFIQVYYNNSDVWDSSYGRSYLNATRTKYTKTITATSDTLFVGFYATNTGTDGNMIIEDFMLEVGSTVTDFEQYTTPTTYSVTWQTEAGTVYVGSIDLTTGVLTDAWSMVDMGDLTYSYDASYTRMYATLLDKERTVTPRTGTVYCEGYLCIDDGRAIGNVPDKSIYCSGLDVYIKDTDYTDVNTFKQAVTGIKLVYPLATHQTYQLTPKEVATILGTNHIFADTGDVSIKFYKPVTNLDTLVEQTKDLAPDLLALASAGNGTSTREAFDMTDETTGTKATRIPDYMFYKNINVENINLPSILEVGEYAFEDAKYIKEINLPNCTSLKKEAFYNAAQKHTSTTLPSIAINLPAVTVVNDRSLSQIGYTGGLTATLVLTACTEIKANGIRGMGSAYMRIAELLLPSLVTLGQESLNYNVFGTVDIGPNCTSIASKPFNYGTVETLIVRATTPPSLNSNGLGVTPTRIKVPSESVDTYKTTANWSTYASIIEAI